MNPNKELFKPIYVVTYRSHARTLACHPTDPDQFVIGEGNGRLSIHSIRNRKHLRSMILPFSAHVKNVVTACSYSRDGQKLFCTLLTGKMCVLDVETAKMRNAYEECAYKSAMRSGLAVDWSNGHLLASTDLGGNGITFYDCRQPVPVSVIVKAHLTWIPDMEFVRDGWPWSRYGSCLLTVCTDGQMKVLNSDGKLLEAVDVGHISHCCALTPEGFEGIGKRYTSFATIAGECMSTVVPEFGLDRKIALPASANALKMKFSSSGSRAFIACDDGSVRIYQRLSQTLIEQKTLMLHQQPISDLDISCSDEHIITTSEDGNVFVTKIGHPNHGATEWFEIA